MDRILLTLTHGIAQLARRWLPPPAWEGPWPDALHALADLWQHDDPARLGAADWEALTVATGWETRRLSGAVIGAALATHFAALAAHGAQQLLLGDSSYPPLLAAIPDPPLGLTVCGDPALLARRAIAVVGSRKASGHAMASSHELGRHLVEAGYVVVSGGAFGCDIAAHVGALGASVRPLPVVVVFAGGLTELYPRQHAAIFARLRAAGAVIVSERLWACDCRQVDFMARNRIIAGLAQATVVMQAAEQSGAGITARCALTQGRDLFVLTHPAGDIRATGSVLLHSEGAYAFEDAASLIGRLERG